MLQMTFKTVYDITRSNGLVPTLLGFGAYLSIVMNLLPLPSHQQRANTITKVISKLYKSKT